MTKLDPGALCLRQASLFLSLLPALGCHEPARGTFLEAEAVLLRSGNGGHCGPTPNLDGCSSPWLSELSGRTDGQREAGKEITQMIPLSSHPGRDAFDTDQYTDVTSLFA